MENSWNLLSIELVSGSAVVGIPSVCHGFHCTGMLRNLGWTQDFQANVMSGVSMGWRLNSYSIMATSAAVMLNLTCCTPHHISCLQQESTQLPIPCITTIFFSFCPSWSFQLFFAVCLILYTVKPLLRDPFMRNNHLISVRDYILQTCYKWC